MLFMHLADLRELLAQGRELSFLEAIRIVAQFSSSSLLNRLTLLPQLILLIPKREKFNPIFKSSLRATFIKGSIKPLSDQIIEILHGLYIKKLNKSLKGASFAGNSNVRQGQIILEERFTLLHDHSASVRVESSNHAVFCQENSQFDELPMDLLDGQPWIFIERILDCVRYVLIEEFNPIFLLVGAPQVDCILMRDFFEFVDFFHQLLILLSVLEGVSNLDKRLSRIGIRNIKKPERKLSAPHFMDKASRVHVWDNIFIVVNCQKTRQYSSGELKKCELRFLPCLILFGWQMNINETHFNLDNHIIMLDRRQSGSKDKVEDPLKLYIDVYNLPEHGNKEDIVFFLWKALEKCKALLRHTNPINRSQVVSQLGCIRLFFRSREETLNCLDLNGIFYGERSFYMKSPLASRTIPQINPGHGLNIRRFASHVQDGFNKLCLFNLPEIKEYEVVNFLATVGELKAFQPAYTGSKFTHCYVEYQKNEETQACLLKLHSQKLKGKTVLVKRAALMGDNSNKTTIGKPKPKSILEKDLHSHYLTFDTVGFFKNMKISCVLLLKGIISVQSEKQAVKEDIRKEVNKIGPTVKIISKDRNVYIEYQRVEYAQICYLLLMNRKFDGKNIDVSFYDPLNFADDILI